VRLGGGSWLVVLWVFAGCVLSGADDASRPVRGAGEGCGAGG
jgi:hypothetical protein